MLFTQWATQAWTCGLLSMTCCPCNVSMIYSYKYICLRTFHCPMSFHFPVLQFGPIAMVIMSKKGGRAVVEFDSPSSAVRNVSCHMPRCSYSSFGCLFAYDSICFSLRLSMYLSVCLPACLPVCLSVCLSIYLSIFLSFLLPHVSFWCQVTCNV